MARKSTKKTPVMTDEAQQAIAAGMPEADALAQFGRILTDEEEAAATAAAEAEATAAAEAEAEAAAAAAAAAEAEAAAGTEASDDPEVTGASDAVEVLTTQLAAANDKLVDVKVELKAAQRELDSIKAAQTGLLDIARAAVNKMQIALGGATLDLTGLSADALISQYAATLTAFTNKYPVGGKATASEERPDNLEATASTPKSDAIRRASQFNPA